MFLVKAAESHGEHDISGSAREFEELQRLRAFERRVHRINDLPAEIADAIEGSKMDSAHDHLNKLLDEK